MAQHLRIAAHGMGEGVVLPALTRVVACVAHGLRQVERDRDRRRMEAPREPHDSLAFLGAQMARVDDRECARGEAPGRRLARIGHDLRRREMARGKGRLARSRSAHKDDQREVRNRELHRRSIAPAARRRQPSLRAHPSGELRAARRADLLALACQAYAGSQWVCDNCGHNYQMHW